MSNEKKRLPQDRLASCDPIWSALRTQAEQLAVSEPELSSFAHATILKHERLEQALSYHLAKKVGSEDLSPMQVREIFEDAFAADSSIGQAVRADLSAVYERDPACHSYVQAFLFFKGFHALQCHRIAHWLWRNKRTWMAYFFQNRVSDLFGVDIHPAAIIGKGDVAFIDPGPENDAHVETILSAIAGEKLTHILVTHTHRDHSPAARALKHATGAPIFGSTLASSMTPISRLPLALFILTVLDGPETPPTA